MLRRRLHSKLKMGDGLKCCSFPKVFIPLAVLKSLLLPLGFIPTILQPLLRRTRNGLALCSKTRADTSNSLRIRRSPCELGCHSEHGVGTHTNAFNDDILTVYQQRNYSDKRREEGSTGRLLAQSLPLYFISATKGKPQKIHNELHYAITLSPSRKLHLTMN